MQGIYLVCFKKPETYKGKQLFGNDYLPAFVEPLKNRLYIRWFNGFTAKISHEHLLFKSHES